MTLTELKYVVALAQERHLGRAAQKCFVTQPTLSLALAKLEDELGIKLFERNKNEVLLTARGQAIVDQARRVLDEVGMIQALARGQVVQQCLDRYTRTPKDWRTAEDVIMALNNIASRHTQARFHISTAADPHLPAPSARRSGRGWRPQSAWRRC